MKTKYWVIGIVLLVLTVIVIVWMKNRKFLAKVPTTPATTPTQPATGRTAAQATNPANMVSNPGTPANAGASLGRG